VTSSEPKIAAVPSVVGVYAHDYVALHAHRAERFDEIVGLQSQFWDDGFPDRNLKDWQDWPSLLAKGLGPDHPDTLASRNNLAVSYTHVGRHEDALALNQQVLADRVRVLGNDHPDTLHSRNNLAASYDNVGRHSPP